MLAYESHINIRGDCCKTEENETPSPYLDDVLSILLYNFSFPDLLTVYDKGIPLIDCKKSELLSGMKSFMLGLL